MAVQPIPSQTVFCRELLTSLDDNYEISSFNYELTDLSEYEMCIINLLDDDEKTLARIILLMHVGSEIKRYDQSTLYADVLRNRASRGLEPGWTRFRSRNSELSCSSSFSGFVRDRFTSPF